MYDPEESNSEGFVSSEDEGSDRELQEQFMAGKLKPGLVTKVEKIVEKKHHNNIPALKLVYNNLKNNLPWIERLDVDSDPAPLAPELAIELGHYKTMSERPLDSGKKSKTKNDDELVNNDFKREMMFYRQAQATVLEAIPRFHSLNIQTRRPEDYFAQMSKSDRHMNKIKRRLLAKKAGLEMSERAKKIREIKKYGKKTQISRLLEKQKEKREFMDNIKKYRKGKIDNLDFISKPKSGKTKSQHKEIGKAKKYGYGGVKKNSKRNTKESFTAEQSKKKGAGAKRPGKMRRKNMKNKSK